MSNSRKKFIWPRISGMSFLWTHANASRTVGNVWTVPSRIAPRTGTPARIPPRGGIGGWEFQLSPSCRPTSYGKIETSPPESTNPSSFRLIVPWVRTIGNIGRRVGGGPGTVRYGKVAALLVTNVDPRRVARPMLLRLPGQGLE